MQDEPYTLIRSDRRSLQLTVDPDGHILVRAPHRASKALIERFIAEKSGWIAKRRAAAAMAPRPDYESGCLLPLLGREITLVKDARVKCAALENGVLRVPDEPPDKTRARVLRFYHDTARQVFGTRLTRYADAMGVAHGAFRLSSAATRWGSCGKDDSINLNWRLIRAPMEIVDYVIVHELCHCKQHNHSKRFWAEVASAMPDYAARRAWLKQNGVSLARD